jgi:hypothetical protein
LASFVLSAATRQAQQQDDENCADHCTRTTAVPDLVR